MTQHTPTLFKHAKRPTWGLAVIAWERDGKRGYLFESGMLRVLAEEFYKLMKPVEQSDEADRATLERLVAQIDTSSASLAVSRASNAPALRFSLSDQTMLFKGEYPEGFVGAWQKKLRGEGAKRRLKRHRNAAAVQAQADLSLPFLEECLASENASTAWLKVAEVLNATDLVPAAQCEALKSAAERAKPESVSALAAVLYGEDDLSGRFDTYVAALQTILRKPPNWELATAVLALVHPTEHVCVRKTSFQTQADWLLPELKGGKRVSAVAYGGFSHLAKVVCEQLEQQNLAPLDYMDVHDFIKLTTSPSAQSRMLALQKAVEVGDEKKSKDPAEAA